MKKLAVLLLVLSGLFAGGYFCSPMIVRAVKVCHINYWAGYTDLELAVVYNRGDLCREDAEIEELAWNKLIAKIHACGNSITHRCEHWIHLMQIVVKAPEPYRAKAWKELCDPKWDYDREAIAQSILLWNKKKDAYTDAAWKMFRGYVGGYMSELFLENVGIRMSGHLPTNDLVAGYAIEELRERNEFSWIVYYALWHASHKGMSCTESLWSQYGNDLTDEDLRQAAKLMTMPEDRARAKKMLAERQATKKPIAEKPKLGLSVREDNARLR